VKEENYNLRHRIMDMDKRHSDQVRALKYRAENSSKEAEKG
jgi:hypothetical protein